MDTPCTSENSKGNILVICQYYSPEPFRITSICQELAARGYAVTVVTGVPNYPMGKVYPGYEHGARRDETAHGVRIHRCPTIARRTGFLFRLLNYYSYSLSACRYVDTLQGSFDAVLINQLSPVMMAQPGIRYAKKHGKKAVLYCLDLWPESLIAGGISRSSPVYRLFRAVSKRIYAACDTIAVTSSAFAAYFCEQFGITGVQYLPQYAEELFTPEQCRKAPDDRIDLMFAGNLGAAQSLPTVLEAAALCRDLPQVHWHIVGDGVMLPSLQKQAEGLPVTFCGRRPVEEMPRFYAMADAMLVTMQRDPVLSLTLPGKVQSYMAAGKPILGAIDGETPRVVSEAGCGFVCAAEDGAALAGLVRRFALLSADERERMGRAAREYYDARFSKERFFTDLERLLCGRARKEA